MDGNWPESTDLPRSCRVTARKKTYAKRSCTEVQSELYMALDQQYITDAEFEDVYDHAGRTRATIRGFINYLVAYEQDQQKKSNPLRGKPLQVGDWTVNAKRWTLAP